MLIPSPSTNSNKKGKKRKQRNFSRCTSATSLVVLNEVPHYKEHASNNVPKVEAVDPNEATRRRAESEMQAEVQHTPKTTLLSNNPQSMGRKRKSNISPSHKKKQQTSIQKRIKRAKDVFD